MAVWGFKSARRVNSASAQPLSSGHRKVLFAENKYGCYFIPDGTQHRPASACILRGDVWEPETIAFMCAHHGDADIIHAGTFFGDFLPALSSSLSSENIVWAFEPNAENYFCATLTTRINGLANVRLFNDALGAEKTWLPQKQFDSKKNLKQGGASKIYTDISGKSPADFQSVSVVRGADLIGSRRVSMIHLDVEGFESQALLGLLPVIRLHRPLLILETIPDDDFMRTLIFPLGYDRSHQLDDNTVFSVKS